MTQEIEVKNKVELTTLNSDKLKDFDYEGKNKILKDFQINQLITIEFSDDGKRSVKELDKKR